MSWGALLDERTIVRGYVSVVGVFLQHVDLQFNLLLFVLQECETDRRTACVGSSRSIVVDTPCDMKAADSVPVGKSCNGLSHEVKL